MNESPQYYCRNSKGVVKGPFAIPELRQLARLGKISKQSLVIVRRSSSQVDLEVQAGNVAGIFSVTAAEQLENSLRSTEVAFPEPTEQIASVTADHAIPQALGFRPPQSDLPSSATPPLPIPASSPSRRDSLPVGIVNVGPPPLPSANRSPIPPPLPNSNTGNILAAGAGLAAGLFLSKALDRHEQQDSLVLKDIDGDGITDSVFGDLNRDGDLDHGVIDIDQDGLVDLGFADANYDGEVDVLLGDINGDGVFDHGVIDSNYDGVADTSWVDIDQDGLVDAGEIGDIDGDWLSDLFS